MAAAEGFDAGVVVDKAAALAAAAAAVFFAVSPQTDAAAKARVFCLLRMLEHRRSARRKHAEDEDAMFLIRVFLLRRLSSLRREGEN